MDKNRFYSIPVKEIKKETPDCVSVTYTVPDDLAEMFWAKPGQYVTLKTDINGESIRRCYSICAQDNPTAFKIAVKKIPQGKFSGFVTEKLREGQLMDVMPPMGQFTRDHIDLKNDNAGLNVALAAGSGITPVIHIIRRTLKNTPSSKFTLVYQNSTHSDLIFGEELMDLKNEFMGRFNSVFIFSREQTELSLTSGRLNREKLDQLFRYFPEFASADGYFLCGPEQMTTFVFDYLQEKQIDQSKILREIFVNQGQTFSKLHSAVKDAKHEGACSLKFKLYGITRSIPVSYDKTILDSLLDNGVDVPFACHGGVCSTCKMKIISGEINMPVNYALEKDQIAQNLALSCCSFPVSSELSVTYDI